MIKQKELLETIHWTMDRNILPGITLSRYHEDIQQTS
jgi:hypothetical protein